ncbi:UNVERIFIED_CONTAM: hypothetical protein K2H54_036361 [Gekko kuhli]
MSGRSQRALLLWKKSGEGFVTRPCLIGPERLRVDGGSFLLETPTLRLNLVVLLLSVISFPSCLSDRVTEFALAKKEESDLKEQNKKEVVAVEEEEEELDPEDLEVFYPTHQWQTVRPGQALPAGLHVQLNLQTGERLARLPSNENEKTDEKDPSRNKSLR